MGQLPVGDPGQNYSGAKSEHQRQALERRLLPQPTAALPLQRGRQFQYREPDTESPTRIQEMAPTLAAADTLYERRLAESAKGDANDALWAIEAIRNYNPEPDLDKIKG